MSGGLGVVVVYPRFVVGDDPDATWSIPIVLALSI